ncbi:MAG: hypothetical protein ACJARD_001512 [Alphaproteobacteria bacterium]|jgi:hypothetical protein
MKYHSACVYCVTLALLLSSQGFANDRLIDSFKNGTFNVDSRYRYEFASQDNRSKDAHASTLRTRLGYTTSEFHDFSGMIEFENISQIGNDNYNDTLNGKTNRPVVADPESTHVNQVYLTYKGIKDTTAYIGRKALNLDNQRFIGSVGWRQNDQTLDGVGFNGTYLPDTKVNYAYVTRTNRIFGTNSPKGHWDSDSHIINISNNSLSIGTLTAYGYLLDFKTDAPAASSQTYGASLKGKQAISKKASFGYHLEYAHQSDYGQNSANYDVNYYHIIPSVTAYNTVISLGYEVLGSNNGNQGFATPLATAHKFNGWADLFLATPVGGLEDLYIDVAYKFTGETAPFSFLSKTLLKAQYHDFSSNHNNVDYGTEIDLFAKMPITENYYLEAKYANYQAESFAADTQRFIFGAGVKF